MTPFEFRNGRFHAEEIDIGCLAQETGTPFYCYSSGALEQNYRAFAGLVPANALIAYSVKANGNLAVLKTLARLGAGADVVSGGELSQGAGGGHSAEQDRVFRRRQDARRNASGS